MSSWLQISNKTAIVTGAASGIGAAIAHALVQQNCSLVLGDSSAVALERVATSLSECTNKEEILMKPFIRTIVCDVTKREDVRDLIHVADDLAAFVSASYATKYEVNKMTNCRTCNKLPPPVASILINSAGLTRDRAIQNMTEEDYDLVLDVNLKGTFLTCQAFCSPDRIEKILSHSYDSNQYIQDSKHDDFGKRSGGNFYSGSHDIGGASIVNIGSIVSQTGNIGQVNYAASKGGVVGLTRALAKEMAYFSTKYIISMKAKFEMSQAGQTHTEIRSTPPSVRVNCILPGFIDTSMTRHVPLHIRKSIEQKIALHQRMGRVEDVADLALFLSSSQRSGYITGQTWECSGMLAL